MIPERTMRWLAESLGTDAIHIATPLANASHTNQRIRMADPDRDLLLRRFTDEARLETDPWYSPVGEVAALEAISGRGLPVPELITADPLAADCEEPTLLLSWLPGSPPPERIDDGEAFVRALAEPMPAIHACPLVARTYEPYFASDGARIEALRPPAWAFDPTVWERAFALVAAGAPDHEVRFIHRDYHHGNTVWEDERVVGIIDWTTGSSGPVGIDLAGMRLNLVWDFDLELADDFLDAWRAVADGSDGYHPFWDVLDSVDAIGGGEPDDNDTTEDLLRSERFVERALLELG